MLMVGQSHRQLEFNEINSLQFHELLTHLTYYKQNISRNYMYLVVSNGHNFMQGKK